MSDEAPEARADEAPFVERLTAPAKVLCLSSLLLGGLGFWIVFEVLAETGFSFPLLAPIAGGVVSSLCAFGLGRGAFALWGRSCCSAPDPSEGLDAPHG